MARQMKDSGVEWMGEIPEEWKLKRLSSLFEDVNKKVSDKDFRPLSVTKQGILPQIEGVAKTDNGDNRKLVQKGNFVINSRSDRKGSSGVSEYEGSVSLINIVFRAKSEVSMQYMHHLLRSYGFQEEFYRWGHGIVADLWTTNSTDARNILLPYPKIEEQSLIATTLTSKCAEIDKVVEQTCATIEEYKKLKQAIITEAVTKGVRGARPMKPSGVEWIGDIPEDWSMKRFKYLGTYRNGLTYKPEDMVDTGTLVLRSSNIQNGQIVLDDNVYVSCAVRDELKVRKGDILICSRNGSRELIGKNAIIKDDMDASFGAFMMIFRSDSPEYVRYILNSSVFSYYLASFFTATINQLTASNFGNMKVPFCCDLIEQKEIVAFLDAKCAEIDRIIEKKEQLIEELGSYKKSLIYEYVTGKKEVKTNMELKVPYSN